MRPAMVLPLQTPKERVDAAEEEERHPAEDHRGAAGCYLLWDEGHDHFWVSDTDEVSAATRRQM